jgi:hypothetical protein
LRNRILQDGSGLNFLQVDGSVDRSPRVDEEARLTGTANEALPAGVKRNAPEQVPCVTAHRGFELLRVIVVTGDWGDARRQHDATQSGGDGQIDTAVANDCVDAILQQRMRSRDSSVQQHGGDCCSGEQAADSGARGGRSGRSAFPNAVPPHHSSTGRSFPKLPHSLGKTSRMRPNAHWHRGRADV